MNKIHNVNIVYLLISNDMRVIQSKCTKTFKTGGGGGARPAGPVSTFEFSSIIVVKSTRNRVTDYELTSPHLR